MESFDLREARREFLARYPDKAKLSPRLSSDEPSQNRSHSPSNSFSPPYELPNAAVIQSSSPVFDDEDEYEYMGSFHDYLEEQASKQRKMEHCAVFVTVVAVLVPMATMNSWIFSGLGPFAGLDTKFDSYMATWRTFNWHPFLMYMGFGFMFTSAILTFKILPMKWLNRKYVHMTLQALSFIFSTGGIVAILYFKTHYFSSGHRNPQDNFYTVHSWIGGATYFFFVVQFAIGMLFFARPQAFLCLLPPHESFIRSVLPWHILAGLAIYFGAILSIVTGINSRQWTFPEEHDRYSTRYVLGNLTALCAVLMALVAYFHHRKHTDRRDNASADSSYQVLSGGNSPKPF